MERSKENEMRNLRRVMLGALLGAVLTSAGVVVVDALVNNDESQHLDQTAITTTTRQQEETANESVGTALVSYSLECVSTDEQITDFVSQTKEIQISAPTIYNQTGSINLGFSQPKPNKYFVDFGGDENILIDREQLSASPNGFTQIVGVAEDRYLLVQLYLAGDDSDAVVDARCIDQAEFTRVITEEPQPLQGQIVGTPSG